MGIRRRTFKEGTLNEEKTFEYVYSDWILQIEKRKVLKNCALNLALAIVSALIVLFAGEHAGAFMQFLLAGAVLYMIFLIPVEIMRLLRNKKRMIEQIRVGKDSIWFDEVEINFYHIQKVQITDISVNTRGAFSVAQRYLILFTDAGKKRYWLGSALSVENEQYLALCEFLEYSFLRRQIEFVYSKRRPVLD